MRSRESVSRGRMVSNLVVMISCWMVAETCAFVAPRDPALALSKSGRSLEPWTNSLMSSKPFALDSSGDGNLGQGIQSKTKVVALSMARSSSMARSKSSFKRISVSGNKFKDFFGNTARYVSAFVSWIVQQISALDKDQRLLLGGVFVLGFVVGRLRPFWKRYLSTEDVPSANRRGPVLKGRAASVSDGDTLRLLHIPTPLHPKKLSKKQKLSETTLPVRVCTIDTPETAKFGKSGQPFGQEAKYHLQDMLEKKTVFCKVLAKDQYGRLVAQVFTKSLLGLRKKFVDEEMLTAGLAEVYQGSGAVYGPKKKDYYLNLEQDAKSAKIGIWSQGKRESAAEYKKRNK